MFHVKHGRAYHFEDSFRGVRLAIARLFGWIDLDCHVTKDGVLVITHWPRPMVHDGFFDPLGLIDPHTPIWELTWAQVSRLRTRRGNYKISKASALVVFALKRGIRVELEAKTPHISAAAFARFRAELVAAGVDPDHVQVKALPQFYRALPKAFAAGFVTLILSHGHAIPKAARPYITYHRGPVRWV